MDFLAKNIKTGEITYLDILNDEFVELTAQEVQDYNTEKRNEVKRAELQLQIDEIDKKRIRAIVEPAQKDENTTWLEFYTQQIQGLRAEIAVL